MFLTQFQINPAREGSRRLLASPNRVHAAVYQAFPDPEPKPDGRRVLWRLDFQEHKVFLYISSPDEPDLTHLVEQAGWPTTATWNTQPYGGVLESLKPESRWAFRLTANPTHDVRPAGGGETVRIGHVTVKAQQDWLLDRAERHGFRITVGTSGAPDLLVHSRNDRKFGRRGDDGSRQGPSATVKMTVATYDGRLEIVDPEQFRRSVSSGIGHGKAYGCGLLTLAAA